MNVPVAGGRRQCLACHAPFDAALTQCPACGGQRSFLIAAPGAGAGPDAGAGGISAYQAVTLAGVGLLVGVVPALVAMATHGLVAIGAWTSLHTLVAGAMGVLLILHREWIYLPARLYISVILTLQVWAAYDGSGHLIGVAYGLAAVSTVVSGVLLMLGLNEKRAPAVLAWGMYAVLAGFLVTAAMSGQMVAGGAQAEGIAVEAKTNRVHDRLLHCAWTAPEAWLVKRIDNGAEARPPADQGINVSVTVTQGTAAAKDGLAAAVDDWIREQGTTLDISKPVACTTKGGLSGFQLEAHSPGSRFYTVWMLQGTGRQFFILMCENSSTYGNQFHLQWEDVANHLAIEAAPAEKPR
jgi:hypothetical protein